MARQASFGRWGAGVLCALALAGAVAAAGVVPASASGGPTVSAVALPAGMTTPPIQGAIALGQDGKEWFVTSNGSSSYGLAEAADTASSSSVSALPATFSYASNAGYPALISGPLGFDWLVGDLLPNLYAVDSGGHQHGVVSTTNDDRDLVAGPDGDLYVSDNGGAAGSSCSPSGQGTIDQYTVTSAPSATLAHSYCAGASVAPDAITTAGGALWFSDDLGNLYKMTTSGTVTQITTANKVVSTGSHTMTQGPDGNLWGISYGSSGYGGSVLKINPSSGATIATYSTGVPSGDVLTSITVGPDGMLWFPEAGSSPEIGQLNPSTGAITSYPLPAGYTLQGSGGVGSAIAAGPGGSVWFTAHTSGGSAAVGEVSGVATSTTTSSSTSTSSTTTSKTSSTTTTSTTAHHKPKPKKCKKGKVRKHGKCVSKHRAHKHKHKKKK